MQQEVERNGAANTKTTWEVRLGMEQGEEINVGGADINWHISLPWS